MAMIALEKALDRQLANVTVITGKWPVNTELLGARLLLSHIRLPYHIQRGVTYPPRSIAIAQMGAPSSHPAPLRLERIIMGNQEPQWPIIMPW